MNSRMLYVCLFLLQMIFVDCFHACIFSDKDSQYAQITNEICIDFCSWFYIEILLYLSDIFRLWSWFLDTFSRVLSVFYNVNEWMQFIIRKIPFSLLSESCFKMYVFLKILLHFFQQKKHYLVCCWFQTFSNILAQMDNLILFIHIGLWRV